MKKLIETKEWSTFVTGVAGGGYKRLRKLQVRLRARLNSMRGLELRMK